MKKIASAVALAALCATSAWAQMSPTQTNVDQRAAAMEIRNARGNQLQSVSSEQAMANALQRCANLPAFYRSDCEARVRGQGEVSGSVLGGGLVKETVTTMPQSELDAERRASQPMTLPPQRN